MALMNTMEAIRSAPNSEHYVPEDTAIPFFHLRAIKDQRASDEAGREIFKEVPYVEIIIPGNNLEKPCRKVTDEDKARWPIQWEAFEKGLEIPEVGTPIGLCGLISKGLAAELKALNVRTVEAFINAPEDMFRKLPADFVMLRDKCREWMSHDKALASAKERIAELEEKLKVAVDSLESRLKEDSSLLSSLRDAGLDVREGESGISAALRYIKGLRTPENGKPPRKSMSTCPHCGGEFKRLSMHIKLKHPEVG